MPPADYFVALETKRDYEFTYETFDYLNGHKLSSVEVTYTVRRGLGH